MPVDTSQALNLRLNHGLTYSQIGKIFGTTKQAIHNKIKNLIPPPETKSYQDHRADILSGLQLKLLSQIDPARLKKISIRDAVISAGVLYDKERLERGLSTQKTVISCVIEAADRPLLEPVQDGQLVTDTEAIPQDTDQESVVDK